jgi:hypothetical protein
MKMKNRIFITFESESGKIREIKEKWVRGHGNDLVINSVLSEDDFVNVNEVLSDQQFFVDQERVCEELNKFIRGLHGFNLKIAELLTTNAPALFEHNLHELHKWAYTIKKITSSSPGKFIILFPCAHSANHLFFLEAEGETSATRVRSVLYKRTDFLLALLREFVISLGVDHDKYGPKTPILSRFSYHARRKARTLGMTIARGLMHWRNSLLHQPKNPLPPADKQRQLLVVVRSVIHAEYFSALLKDQRILCLVQDGLAVYPKVLARARLEGASKIIHCYDLVSPSKILILTFRLLFKSLKFTLESLRNRRHYVFVLDGMPIDLTTSIKECIVGSLDTLLLSTAISSVASRQEYCLKAIAHCELFTAYPRAIKTLASRLRIPTFQFAFATYEMRPVPDFIHADHFFCFSLQQRKSILSVKNRFEHSRVDYAGNLLIGHSIGDDDINAKGAGLKNIVLYYSQPLDELADEAFLSVKRITDSMDLSLKLVMHPRENPEKFMKYGHDLCVLTNEMYIKQRAILFAKTLFAVTRSSNVGYQLLLRNIPLINYQVTAKDALVKHEYYEGYPLLVQTESQFIDILKNAQYYIGKYREFRGAYIKTSFDDKGANEVLSKIFN